MPGHTVPVPRQSRGRRRTGTKRPRRDRRRQLQPDTASAGHRPAAAAPAAATATTASPRTLPAGPSGTGSGDSAPASRVKNSRTRPAEAPNRRSRPRTVSSGTPDAAAIDRNPCPRAARASMSPITAVPSHRRASTHAGRRTCVARHEPHRARRGRTLTGTRPAVKTRRGTAWPHPPSRPPQPGHESPPLRRKSSAAAMLLPTVSNGASKHLTALPRASPKVTGKAGPVTDTLTVSSHATPPQPEPPRKKRILLRQADDEPGDARDRRRAAGLAPLARVVLLRGQPAVPGEERRRCYREDFGPAVTRYEPSQRGEPDPVGWLVTYPASVAAQHRVLVPEYQQFGILRQVRAEYQGG